MLAFVLILSACTPSAPSPALQAVGTQTPTSALTPYRSPTSTRVQPTQTIVVTIPVTPSPTATPFLHTITNDDTLLGLAFRYGVSLEALKTANPRVNPNAMTVGSQLVIPVATQATQEMPTPTPLPIQVGQPWCARTGDGGAWCVVGLLNTLDTTLENLSVWIGLYDSQGENIISLVAYAPLDILRPGATMPLMAYFTPPLPVEFSARAELLAASTIASNDPRYLDVQVETTTIAISPDGSQAAVSGNVILPQGASAPSQVWVLAVAYDMDNHIIGSRKWKSTSDTNFVVTVFSLSGAIDHVSILAEVRP